MAAAAVTNQVNMQIFVKFRMIAALIVATVSLSVGQVSTALVVVDGEVNTAPAADDAGWDYVGSLGNGTGIYLGNGWIMTAAHVSLSTPFVLDNGSYNVIGSSVVTFNNDDDSVVDMRLYQINGDPGLPALSIRREPIHISTAQVIATGILAGETFRAGQYTGYEWATERDKSWGSNWISSVDITKTVNDRTTESFAMEFNKGVNAVNFESQAANHDSGGAIFIKNDQGQWELSGMIFAILQGLSDKSTFNYDLTYAVDLPHYRTDLFNAMYTGGDANLDGKVDLIDLVIVGENYNLETGGYWEIGDFNGDGKVDLIDLTTLGENYGEAPAMTAGDFNSLNVPLGDVQFNIPEPSALALLAIASGMAFYRRSSR